VLIRLKQPLHVRDFQKYLRVVRLGQEADLVSFTAGFAQKIDSGSLA
jgi:hypothetical protein